MDDRTCQLCGEPITRRLERGPQLKYCSDPCRARGRHAKKIAAQNARRAAERAAKSPDPRQCPQCGGPAERLPGKRGLPPTYCSPLCKSRAAKSRAVADGRHAEQLAAANARAAAEWAANRKPCPYCGDLMDGWRVQCEAPECKRRLIVERNSARQREYRERAGRWPSQEYRTPESIERSNANAAAKRGARQAAGLPAHPWTEARKAAYQRRRAAKRGATTEKFTPLEIFERDGWRCGICGREVNCNLAYPHPKSASVDHVEPLSRGGEHSRANTRLAHLDCNVQRGNRGSGEQLLLIG